MRGRSRPGAQGALPGMSGPQEPLGPDERAVRAHLCSARFQSGVDGGRWRLISIAWPHVFVAVAAARRCTERVYAAIRPHRLPAKRHGRHLGLRYERPACRRSAAQRRTRHSVFRSDWEGAGRFTQPGIASPSTLTPTGRNSTRGKPGTRGGITHLLSDQRL